MSWAARFAALYFLLASASITTGVFGIERPAIAWTFAGVLTIAARASMRDARLEATGRFRP
jgi:hypothetical protein